jgi:hypothetical protein
MAKKKHVGLAGTDWVQCSVSQGGTLREVNADGEYITDIFVPPGKHRASIFMIGIGRGHCLTPGVDVVCYTPEEQTRPITWGDMASETAANQSFRVDRAEREKRRNDRLEARQNALERRLALQDRALARSRGEDPDATLETPETLHGETDDEQSAPDATAQ